MRGTGVYRPLYCLWVIGLWLCTPFSSKIRRGLWGRRGLLQRLKQSGLEPGRATYWFHFASSGELEQAIPVMDALKTREPTSQIALTFFSPTGKRAVELEQQRRANKNQSIPWDFADYSPFDFPFSVHAFVKELRPRALVCLHREIWPELWEQCHRRSIPIYLFGVYFSSGAKRWIFFYRRWLRQASCIGTVDETTAEWLRSEIPSLRVESLGDPRVDRVLARKSLFEPSKELPHPLFVGASLWPQDFAALDEALKRLFNRGWVVFLVPHEPSSRMLCQLRQWAEQQGYPYALASTMQHVPRLVLVDTVGGLAELYSKARLTFVGGSFRARVHNVLEPAAWGVPILTGPHISNSLEAQSLRDQGALFSARDPQDLAEQIQRLTEDAQVLSQMGQQALKYVLDRGQSGARCAGILTADHKV